VVINLINKNSQLFLYYPNCQVTAAALKSEHALTAWSSKSILTFFILGYKKTAWSKRRI